MSRTQSAFNRIIFRPFLIVKFYFLLAGHKVDFIAPCGAKKSTFWPASRKKIVCNTGKTFIFPSCTMYYSNRKYCYVLKYIICVIYFYFIYLLLFFSYFKLFCVQTGRKSRIACLRVERHAANCASATQSGKMFIPPASTRENVQTARFNGRKCSYRLTLRCPRLTTRSHAMRLFPPIWTQNVVCTSSDMVAM